MIINGVANHIHMLIGFNPDCNISDLVRDVKSNSSKWINEQRKVKGKFEWQHGFGAFTVGNSQVQNIINYISVQEEHHRIKTFREEYINLLESYNIDFVPKYIFDDVSVAPTELE